MRYTIGIDLGTSSVKVALLGENAVVAATASHDYPILSPWPGWAEQDPHDWWNAMCSALRAALAQAGAMDRDVAAVAVGGQMHGTVLLDEAGQVVRCAIIWPDLRAVAEAARASSDLEASGVVARRGGGVSPGFMLASLLWLRDHEPAVWDRATTALLPKDYLRYRLTGARGAAPSDGCGAPKASPIAWVMRWSRYRRPEAAPSGLSWRAGSRARR